jgi:hypothetical protein
MRSRAMKVMTRAAHFKARITEKGQTTEVETYQVAVGNGRHYGGGNVVEETAEIDDGHLDLYSLEMTNLWKLALMLRSFRSGTAWRLARGAHGSLRRVRHRDQAAYAGEHRWRDRHRDPRRISRSTPRRSRSSRRAPGPGRGGGPAASLSSLRAPRKPAPLRRSPLRNLSALRSCRSRLRRCRLETSLYLPVKEFLEGLGYTVKGEVGPCDLVGVRAGDPSVVVIGELKLTFNLELILQGVDRMRIGDEVWLAARLSARGKGRESDPRYRDLCRRLGSRAFGGRQHPARSTCSYPRLRQRRARTRNGVPAWSTSIRRRQGDPVLGGSTRRPVMTAYRQQALACAAAMSRGAATRPRDLKPTCPDAQKILHRNVYGWFATTRARRLCADRRPAAALWNSGSRPSLQPSRIGMR